MDSVSSLLLSHCRQTPCFRPADAVKLLYQRAFGNGHFITDPNKSLARIESELVYCLAGGPLWEEVSNTQVRMHLGPASAMGISAQTINRLFLSSSPTGDNAVFKNSLTALCALSETGQLPFTLQELDVYLRDYKAAGCPPVSHSEEYRAQVHPAYRLIDRYYIPVLPVLASLDRLLKTGGPVAVAIEGGSATGKTMLGERLAQLYDCNLFHTDDFFLRPSQRSEARLAQPGGNIDVERLREQVTSRLGTIVHYQKYDCHSDRIGPMLTIPPCRMNIVEGAYSTHPLLRAVYHLTLFLRADEEERRKRIEARNGPMAEMFFSRWIPMEDAFFAAMDSQRTCDYILEWQKP